MEEQTNEKNEIIAELKHQITLRKWCHKCLGKVTIHRDGNLLRCTKNTCRNTQDLYSNEFMNKITIADNLVYNAIELWTYGSCTKIITSFLKINKHTLTMIKQSISLMFDNFFEHENYKIGGENIIVEIDESKFGKRKYNLGHAVEGVWVLGLVERTAERKIVIVEVPNRTAATLTSFITKYVRPGSIIHTDLWRGYSKLEEFDYTHYTINHSLNYVDPITGCHTNTIEGNWSGVKKLVSSNNRCAGKVKIYLQLYMFKRLHGDLTFKTIINKLFS